MNNRLIIAAAGAGKTTQIIKEALALDTCGGKILITTYTESNRDEILAKLYQRNKCIPGNVDVVTWFSFLLRHGVRPYQTALSDNLDGVRVGFHLCESRSSKMSPEEDIRRHYFTEDYRIYSDKISKFIIKTDKECAGLVFKRIKDLYSYVFIDEAQDLAGWDLEVVRELSLNVGNLCLVCDPRQTVYLTNPSSKYKQYNPGKIKDFINDECQVSQFQIDEDSLKVTHRFGKNIAKFSSGVFSASDLPATEVCGDSGCMRSDEHQGIFLVREKDCGLYLKTYQNTKVLRSMKSDPKKNEINIRKTKGLTFDRVLIHPTESMRKYLRTGDASTSFNKSKTGKMNFYVALTRARISVAIIYNQRPDKFDNLVSVWRGGHSLSQPAML